MSRADFFPRTCAECREHDPHAPADERGTAAACGAYPGIRVKPGSKACGTPRSQLREPRVEQEAMLL